mmetsp:Transcript_18637/g.38866  ORF Transcript_18637/g.38866 Transcript_18637/m.38866 type:complete len:436 (+) Transcript_18637:123-1430(+)
MNDELSNPSMNNLTQERIEIIARLLFLLSIALNSLGQIIQCIPQTHNNILRALLSLLPLQLLLLQIHSRRLLGIVIHSLRVFDHIPRLLLQGLGAERNPSIDLIVIDDHALDPLTGFEHRLEIINAIHGNLRNVKKAGHAPDLDEGSVRFERLDDPVDDVSPRQIFHLRFDDGASVGDDEFVIVAVDFEELEGEGLSDEVFVGEASREVGSGEEGAESSDEEDGSSAVDGDAFGFEYVVGLLHGDDVVPCLAVLDASDGDEELTVFVFVGDDFEFFFVVDGEEGFDGDALFLEEGGFLEGEEGGGFGADVDDAASLVVLYDGAFDDVVSVEGVGGGGYGVFEGGVGESDFVFDFGGDGGDGSFVAGFDAVEAGELLGLFEGGLEGGGGSNGVANGRHEGLGRRCQHDEGGDQFHFWGILHDGNATTMNNYRGGSA